MNKKKIKTDQEELPRVQQSEPETFRSSTSLWLWFLGGFILTFVTILLLGKKNSLHSSGQALIQYQLWQYYIVEIRRVLSSTGEFSPTSGSGYAAFVALTLHLGASGLGGLITLGLGTGIRCLRR